MSEMTVKIEIPGLTQAVACLADAVDRLASAGGCAPQVQAPVDTAPPAPPASSITPPAPQPTTNPAAPVTPPAAPVTPPAAPVTPPAAPAVPVAGAPSYSLDQIAKAGAALVDAGKMDALLALLGRYGVQAITQLAPDQYGAFATELRALGAQL